MLETSQVLSLFHCGDVTNDLYCSQWPLSRMDVGDNISHFRNLGSLLVEDEWSISSPLGTHLNPLEYDDGWTLGTRPCNHEDKFCPSWEQNHGHQASASNCTD